MSPLQNNGREIHAKVTNKKKNIMAVAVEVECR